MFIFLTKSLFTTSLSLLKSTETDTDLSASFNFFEEFSIYQYLIYLHQILN